MKLLRPLSMLRRWTGPRGWWAFLAVWALLAVGGGLAVWLLLLSPSGMMTDATSRDLPNPHLQLFQPFEDRTELRLSDLQGRPVVLNFWGTWCPPCRAEMPHFESVWNKRKGEGLVVLGVNSLDEEQAARDFLQQVGVTYPIAGDTSGEIVLQFEVRAFPATYFIDRSGNIHRTWVGPLNESKLDELASEILS